MNLKLQEISGLEILEAMYYGCKIIDWKAATPELIIKDKILRYLVI